MGLKKIPHMNAGDGETSYAQNSGLQNVAISKTLPVLDETLKNMFEDRGFSKSCSFKMVDLGCASGPNTLLVISHIVEIIQDLCKNNSYNKVKNFQIFLNDLPSNDFNNLFKLVENFYEQNKGIERESKCFIYGLPGSFYGRLFPGKTLHFAYSSYAIHWLSQVPQGLKNQNKENIYMAMTSPPEVFEAYVKQYQRDMFKFLSLRGKEIISGGRMVLTFIGRNDEYPFFKDYFGLYSILAKSLLDMVNEGLINEYDLHSFNLPIFHPSQQEVKTIIDKEGSFELENVSAVPVPWDANRDTTDYFVFNKNKSAKLVSVSIRAVMEPMLTSHFGKSINCDVVFQKFEEKMCEYLSKGEYSTYFNIIISLRRRSQKSK